MYDHLNVPIAIISDDTYVPSIQGLSFLDCVVKPYTSSVHVLSQMNVASTFFLKCSFGTNDNLYYHYEQGSRYILAIIHWWQRNNYLHYGRTPHKQPLSMIIGL